MATNRSPSARTKGELSVGFRTPLPEDGNTLWALAGAAGLDLNSAYAYVMWGGYFSQTSVVAHVDGEVVGFVTGFQPPADPTTLFVWQVAVDGDQRGRGVAGAMLDELLRRVRPRHVEATVNPSNEASRALFERFGRRHGVAVTTRTAFPAALFPGGHEAEVLHRIGPFEEPATLPPPPDAHTP